MNQDQLEVKDALEFLEAEYLLPNSLEIEREVCGLMMKDASLRLQGASLIKETDFFANAYKQTFKSIIILIERGEDVSTLTVANVLRSRGFLQEVGGFAGVEMIEKTLTQTKSSLTSLAKILRDKAIQREIFKVCRMIAADCYSPDAEATTILRKAEDNFSRLLSNSLQANTVKSMREITAETLLELDRWKSGVTTAIKTGIPEWDKYLVYGGFSPGDLIYIAAFSSYGKTAIVWQIIMNMARRGHPVLFFSQEMEAFKLALRAMQGSASKHTADGKGFQFTPYSMRYAENKEENYKLAKLLLEEMQDLPIYVDDKTRNWRDMKSKARLFKDKIDIKAAFGDYIQLSEIDLNVRNSQRNQEVATISRETKQTAVELGIPWTWISQLSRSSQSSDEPELIHLADSSQQEKDADVVAFIYGDGTKTQDDLRRVKTKFAKQRNGPVGKVIDLDFETDKQLFFSQGMLALTGEKPNEYHQTVEKVTQKTEPTQSVNDAIDDIPFE